MRMRLQAIVVMMLALAFGATSVWAQSWRYDGSSVCYYSTAVKTCLDRAQLSQFIFNFDPNASTDMPSAKANAEIGKLLDMLHANWTTQNPPIKPKTNALHDQLVAYFDGNAELLDQLKKLYAQDKENLNFLLQNDPANKHDWQMAVARWKFRIEAVQGYANRVMRVKTAAVAETQADAQKVYLDGDSGIRPAYEEDRGVTEREFAANQILIALKESFSRQPAAKNSAGGSAGTRN